MKEPLHYLLMASHLSFQRGLLTALKDTGLSPGQPKVLDYLLTHDGAVQKEIAAACHIEQATITSLLLGMENKGLITRQNKNGNRRSLYVHLTDRGRELAVRVDGEFDVIESRALSGFTDSEAEELCEKLSRLLENIRPDSRSLP